MKRLNKRTEKKTDRDREQNTGMYTDKTRIVKKRKKVYRSSYIHGVATAKAVPFSFKE